MRHATEHATALVWPIAPLALYGHDLDDPVSVLLLAGILAMFFVFIWTIFKVEKQLNWEGESLFYPWRVRSVKRDARRLDGVLSTSIRRLVSGEDEENVLSTLHLQTSGGRVLPGRARRHYDRAVTHLTEAAERDWVFDAERRKRALEEAVKALWMTRVEHLRVVIE